MIEYITGEVVEVTPATAVIECMGIGYLLNIFVEHLFGSGKGKTARLYVYEAIREDAYQLYGFGDRHERELFVSLISVSGVGAQHGAHDSVVAQSGRTVERCVSSRRI